MKTLSTFVTFIFIAIFGFSQTTIWSEDFTSGSYSVTLGGEGNDGTADYFQTTNGSNIGITYTGFTGNFFACQDIDDGGWTGSAAPSQLTWSSINISNYSSLSFSGLFASYTNNKIDDNDYCKIEYKIDAGSWITLLSFENDGSQYNTYFLEDTDFDGTGDGTQLTSSAVLFTKSIPTTGSSIDIRITVSVNSGGEDIAFDGFELKGTLNSSNSTESIIEKKSGWSEPTNIAYTSYSATSGLTTSNSIEVASFTIKDGGSDGTDVDAVSTKLTDISFTVTNYDNLAALAIFDGTTNVAEVTSFSSTTVSFSSLTLEAADEGTKDFTLRATYKTNVTDNDNLKFTISSATADNAGSLFAAADAGAATTDDTGNNNKIVVTADRLRFDANKPPSSVLNGVNFSVRVESTDANGNIDVDATNSISLVRASGTGVLSSATGLTQSLVNGVYEWVDVQYDTDENFTIEAQNASLINVTSGTITCTSGSSKIAWINEFHYDNDGTDTIESVEICLVNASSYNLSDFTVTLYNGSGGASYSSVTLNNYTAGTTYDNVSTYSYNYTSNGISIQNGAPDGIALSYNDGTKAIVLLEFISYEGDFTATDGPASGVQSQDVGVTETSSTVAGTSIGRVGTNDEWSWETGNTSSWGAENNKSDGGTQVLPIEIIYFSAKTIDNHIQLNWQTATETNNDFFTIERSFDAVNFESVGTVLGAGNSNSLRNYQFIDQYPPIGKILYYRLKQTDYNGAFSYSNTLSVNVDNNELKVLKVYANDDLINLELYSEENRNAYVEVFDLNGRLIIHKDLSLVKGVNRFKFDAQRLKESIFIIRLVSSSSVIVQKLLIE